QEGLSIALIEAMATGTPAVVTDAGGLPEVVRNGREGFVVARRNPSDMASALIRLLRDVSLRREMGEAARVRARDFDIRRTLARTEDVYRGLI
ncbi:MAG: glycosyltransferase, partial [Vicinamibacterales bacterium]